MKMRILSAVVGIPLIILTLAFHSVFPLCVNILCAVASLVCTVELLNAKQLTKDFAISVPCMLFSALLPMLVTVDLWQIILFLFVFYIFTLMIVKSKKYSFADISYIFTSIGLSTAGLGCMVSASNLDNTHSCFYVTLCIVIPWVADAGAYFVGSFFGKHKLCPDVSPKKTVEGAVGGVVIGIIGAMLDAVVYQYIIFADKASVDFVGVFVVAVIGTVTSMIGDLTFSLIKRSCHVKDYGNVIPGHGGILDRCDSIIMTAPMIFIFIQYWPLTVVL
ncbi:MAG: CDP-archaeol synthase [Acutalibacteraceae bacterium]|nr:CDP-archaeol synthase [Acutalibacteraceae bacterium]